MIMDQAPAPAQGKRIILVVDDDSAVRDSHKFSLELEGFEVRTYSNPAEFLNEDNLPESGCLIVNYQMPGMNGLQLVARLRDRQFSMPIILVTGYSNDNLRKRAAIAGVSIVEKPFLKHRLVDCVRRAFDGQNA
jgi:two-component system, LuxR family, response regulator FixJ